jgi:F-type H+-transporting ATPase subunit epsilon
MAKQPLQCSLITPEGKLYEELVDSVVIPAHDGEMGIQFNRSPLMCKLGAGRMKVRIGDDHQSWFVNAGFAQVLENKIMVLTQQAVKTEQLDPIKAKAQLDQARQIKVRDEITACRRREMEAAARAQLRLAPKKQQTE